MARLAASSSHDWKSIEANVKGCDFKCDLTDQRIFAAEAPQNERWESLVDTLRSQKG